MNGKELTDDKEVIRLLEIFASDNEPDGVDRLAGMALDLIRRLQFGYSSASKASEEWKAKYEKERKENAEYEQKLYDGELLSKDYHDEQVLHYADENNKLRKENTKLKTELQKECQEHLAFAKLAEKADKQQKDEIEFLTKIIGMSKRKTRIADLLREIERLTEENDHLDMVAKQALADYQNAQVQVDELKVRNEKYLESIESVQAGRCRFRCELTQQAVKDTAKEILQELYEYPHEYHEKKILEIARRKGVKVE